MIRVYYLETERINGTDVVKGIEHIHNSILGVEGTFRKLTQDTTDSEHSALTTICSSWRKATKSEKAELKALEFPAVPVKPVFEANLTLSIASRLESIEQFLKRLYGKESR